MRTSGVPSYAPHPPPPPPPPHYRTSRPTTDEKYEGETACKRTVVVELESGIATSISPIT